MNILKVILRLLAIVLVPVLVASCTYIVMRSAFLKPAKPGDEQKIIVEIDKGKSFKEICRQLKASGLIKYAWTLDLIARFKKKDAHINAGEYELSPSMTPLEILDKLSKGDVYKRVVTVAEGLSIWQIGALVEKAGLLPKQEFDSALTDPGLLAEAGLRAASFEGYLYPETYHFSRPITAREIIWRMMKLGETHWPAEFTQAADKLVMSRHEVLTLASIIEKESQIKEEQPIVSSVFHNRLKQGMKLQADPTVIYGIGLDKFNGNITKVDLTTPTPYNTYTNFGLPAGPIANPSENAVRAALFPAKTEYLYFVADKRGRHVFSTTLAEHNEAVARLVAD